MKYDNFFANLNQLFPAFWRYPSHGQFLEACAYYWYAFPLLLLGGTVLYLRRGAWLRLTLVWGFCLGLIALLHIAEPVTERRFYAEVNYLPLILFTAMPIIFEWMPQRKSRWLTPLLGLILALRLAVIAGNHLPYAQRLEWIAGQLDNAPRGTDFFYLSAGEAPKNPLKMTWAVAYESLLLTALNHPDSARTLVILPDPAVRRDDLQSGKSMVSEIQVHPLDTLKQRYFRLEPAPYHHLSSTSR